MNTKLGKRYASRKAYGVLSRNGFFDIWPLREWHSVCLTYDGSNNLQVYVDGSVKTVQSYTQEDFNSGNIMLFDEIKRYE